MSLRLVAAVVLLLLLLALPSQVTAQAGPGGPPKLVQVTEPTPWFDRPGVNFTYSIRGTYEGLQGTQSYQGTASVDVLGTASNGSLRLVTSSTTTNALFPNGTLYDDPFFPGYVQVLPLAFVVPHSYSLLAPTYGLTFTFLGNVSMDFEGSSVQTYAYSVSAISSGEGQSHIVKYYRILPSDGAILQVELTNSEVGSILNMTLADMALPKSSSPSTLQFTAPDFAVPGNFLTYRNLEVASQQVNYTVIFAEPGGVFAYERTVENSGVPTGSQFYVDDFSAPSFYPASTTFADVITFPVAVGSLEAGVLTFQGNTSVRTADGYFHTRAYANQTIGFEAYLDDSTGVAVYLELPGGNLELSASNFLVPISPTQQYAWLIDLIPAGLAVAIALLVVFHFKKTPRRRARRS